MVLLRSGRILTHHPLYIPPPPPSQFSILDGHAATPVPTVDPKVEPLTDTITTNTPSPMIRIIDGLVSDLPPHPIDTLPSSLSLSGRDYPSSSIFFISLPHPHLRPPISIMWEDIIGSGGDDNTPEDGIIIIVDSCSGGPLPSYSNGLKLRRSGSPPFVEEGDAGTGPICGGSFPSGDGVTDWAVGSVGEMVSVSIARVAATLTVPLLFQGGVNLGQLLATLPTTLVILGPVTGVAILLGLYGAVTVASTTGWVHVTYVPGGHWMMLCRRIRRTGVLYQRAFLAVHLWTLLSAVDATLLRATVGCVFAIAHQPAVSTLAREAETVGLSLSGRRASDWETGLLDLRNTDY